MVPFDYSLVFKIFLITEKHLRKSKQQFPSIDNHVNIITQTPIPHGPFEGRFLQFFHGPTIEELLNDVKDEKFGEILHLSPIISSQHEFSKNILDLPDIYNRIIFPGTIADVLFVSENKNPKNYHKISVPCMVRKSLEQNWEIEWMPINEGITEYHLIAAIKYQ